jgi:hypothetical protein
MRSSFVYLISIQIATLSILVRFCRDARDRSNKPSNSQVPKKTLAVGEVVAVFAGVRMAGEHLAGFVDPIELPIRRERIVVGDVTPDFHEVDFSARDCDAPSPSAVPVSLPSSTSFAFDLRDVEGRDFTAFDFIQADLNFAAQLLAADFPHVVGLTQPSDQFTAFFRRESRCCGLNFAKRAHDSRLTNGSGRASATLESQMNL